MSGNHNYWEDRIVEITKSALNYWNEAGSEHSLEYSGTGTSNPYVRYEYNGSYSLYGTTYYTCDPVWHDSDVDDIYIIMNRGHWRYDRTSYKFLNTLSHEFGHALSLSHTQDSSNYISILMRPNGFVGSRHLTEDDKYGVRSIYGKDDQKIQVSRSYKNYVGGSIKTKQDGYLTPLYYAFGTDYQTYSKPQLIYQPSSNYDYIMVWVKSNTREVNYKFVNDYTPASDLVDQDLIAASGSLGIRHYIEDSETLTAPSIAVNSNGTHAVIAWKQETQNQYQNNSDDIKTLSINTGVHSAQVYSDGKVFSNSSCSNNDFSCFKAKTIGAPIVSWVQSWNRFVLFYPVLGNDNWKIAYIYSTDSTGSNWNTNDIRYLNLESNWNPFAVKCGLKDYNGSPSGCLLVFNEIKTNSNYTYADYVAKTTYKILETTSNYPESSGFMVKDLNKYNPSSWNRKNYGHYSMDLRTDNYDGDYNNIAIINRIIVSEKARLNNLVLEIKKSTNGVWNGSLSNQYVYTGGLKTRTGFSIVWNPLKRFYKYIHIEE